MSDEPLPGQSDLKAKEQEAWVRRHKTNRPIVGKCRNCGRPLVHGETRPYLHRLEDFAPDKPIDCLAPAPEEHP